MTHGKYTSLFEEEIRKITKSKYAITVSSCTAGFASINLASNFKKGWSYCSLLHTATAHAVEYTGAKVVFADVELQQEISH